MSLNQVYLIGNIGKDPELKYTASNSAICEFSLATSEKYKDKDDKWQSKTEWHKVKVWNKQAEFVAANVKKGMQVCVEGKITTRSWEKEGVKHYMTEIIAQRVLMLGLVEKKQVEKAVEISDSFDYSVDQIPF